MCPKWMSKKQAHPGISNITAFSLTVAKVTLIKSYVNHYEGDCTSPEPELILEARADAFKNRQSSR